MNWTRKSEEKRVESNLLYAASTRAAQGSATERGLFNASVGKFIVATVIEDVEAAKMKKNEKVEEG